MTTTLAQLRTRIRQRSDNEYTDGKFVTDAEIDALINVSHKRLFAKLCEAGLHTVAENIYIFTPSSGVPLDGALSYNLPDDCYAVAGVFRLENDYFIPLSRHDQRLMPRTTEETIAWSYRTHGRLESAQIEFNPRISTGEYHVRYVGVPTDLSDDADTVEGVVGWEEWIVLDVAHKLLFKEKQWEAADRIKAEKQEVAYEIQGEAYQRDMQDGISVADVRSHRSDNLFDDDGFLPGGHRGVRGYWGSF